MFSHTLFFNCTISYLSKNYLLLKYTVYYLKSTFKERKILKIYFKNNIEINIQVHNIDYNFSEKQIKSKI